MSAARRVAVICSMLAVAGSAAACTGGHQADQATTAPSTNSSTAAVSTTIATRWWSNSAAQSGSRIDPAHPDAVASKLHPSRSDYCQMLKQTLAAKKSILPGVAATDPALLASTKAFVSELEAVAPTPVTGSWRLLGSAVTSLVASGGDATKVKGVDAAAVQKVADILTTEPHGSGS